MKDRAWPSSSHRGDRWVVFGVFAVLTLLVWGLFAFRRGMFQDDAALLGEVAAERGQGVWHLLSHPQGTPTRRLLAAPCVLALLFQRPVWVLQALYGLSWLAIGLLSAAVLRELFPRDRWLAFVGGSLTLCATSDYLTDSLVELGYNFSALFFLLALVSLLRWWRTHRPLWLLPTGLFLAASVWTTDAALPAALLTPLLLWGWQRFRLSRRLWLVTIFWLGVLSPYLVVLGRALRDPSGYASRALVPMGFWSAVGRTMLLFGFNFDFWGWGPARENWFPAPPRAFAERIALAGALGGVILVLVVGWRLWNTSNHDLPEPNEPKTRPATIAVLFLLMALLSNAAYAFVQQSEHFYRTQVMSRIFVSLFLALCAAALGRVTENPAVAFALPVLFVGFGVYGGLERQNYYLGYWLRHRTELQSIVENAPRLRDDTRLILRLPLHRYFSAVETEYLAMSWARLIYGDPTFLNRTFVWYAGRGTACTVDGEYLLCTREGNAVPVSIPIARAVVMTYSPAENRFALDEKLPGAAPGTPASRLYPPREEILDVPISRSGRGILGIPSGHVP